MFARLRRRLHLFLYSKCESYICKHNSHYAHLKQFLREESLSSALVGHLRGRRLEIQWVDDPDKGYAKQFIHVMSGDNPMFARLKQRNFKGVTQGEIK